MPEVESTTTDKKMESPTKGSPTKKEIDIATQAVNHFAQGKRHLLVNDIPSAVNSLQEACRLLAEQYGELAPECGDAYFYYGRALLEMARLESGVLGNALDGVPEGEDMENSQVENPEKMTADEKEMVSEKVGEALEEACKAWDDRVNGHSKSNDDVKEAEVNKNEEEATGEKEVKKGGDNEGMEVEMKSEVVDESATKETGVTTEKKGCQEKSMQGQEEVKESKKDGAKVDDAKEGDEASEAMDVEMDTEEKCEKEGEKSEKGGDPEEREKGEGDKLEPTVQGAKEEAKTEDAKEKSKTKDAKEESKADGAKEESKADGAKEESQSDGAKEESKDSGAKEESKADGAKENSKADGDKEESKANGAKEESKADGAKEESKADGAKEESKADGAKEDSKADGAKEESKANGAKEESKADGAKGESKTDDAKGESKADGAKEESKAEGAKEESEAKSVEAESKEGSEEEKTKDKSMGGEVAADGSNKVEDKLESEKNGEKAKEESENEVAEKAKDESAETEDMDVDEAQPGEKAEGKDVKPEDKTEAGEKAAEGASKGTVDCKDEKVKEEEAVEKDVKTKEESSKAINGVAVTNGDSQKEGSTEGEDEDENDGDEDNEDEDEEKDESQSQEEGSQEEGEKTDEDEDVSNLQLAWEMLELAKCIFQKQMEGNPDMALKVAQVHLKLGELSLENENYAQSVEDLTRCLDIQQKILEPDNRCLAESHYQLGVAHSFSDEFDKAIESFNSSIRVIEDRKINLKKKIEEKSTWTEEQRTKDAAEKPDPFYTEQGEIDELDQLVPDIKEKVVDMEEMKKDSKERIAKITKNIGLGKALGSPSSSGMSPGSSTSTVGFGSPSAFGSPSTEAKPIEAKPVSNIGHLIRKKRKPEDEAGDTSKKSRAEDGTARNGIGSASDTKSNGVSVEKMESEESQPTSTSAAEEPNKEEEKKTEVA